MVGRPKSSGSRPKLIRRPKHGSSVLRNVGLFPGYNEGSVLDQDDAVSTSLSNSCEFAETWR